MLLPTVLPCPWHAGSDFLHMVLQFARKRKHLGFKFNQWLLERGPYHPPPAPSPSCHPPPLLPLHPCCRIPEGSRSLAKDGGQPDGPDSWDRDWTSTLEMVPKHHVQGATLDLPISRVFRLSSATSLLLEVLEGTEKTSVHWKCVSDLLRRRRQGCPRLSSWQRSAPVVPEGGRNIPSWEHCSSSSKSWSTGFWLLVHFDSGVESRSIFPTFFWDAIKFVPYGHNNNYIYAYISFYICVHTYISIVYLPNFMQILSIWLIS